VDAVGRALAGVILLASTVAAQPPARRAAFEVASVRLAAKHGPPAKPLFCGFDNHGRFQAYGWVRYFVACAYERGFGKIDDFILSGASWIDAEFYQIDARLAAEDVSLTQPDRLAILRALLAERFKLSLHQETRESPMYALVASKHGGLGLRPADASCVNASCGRDLIGPWSIRSRAITMPQLATLLSSRTGRRVEDRTGLAGAYDLSLEWKPALTAPPSPEAGSPNFLPVDPAPSSIFGAVEEQLGLKLQSIKGTTDVIVIDHVERPSPN
jgi:uncharacterized protein (TIGR03435 family)